MRFSAWVFCWLLLCGGGAWAGEPAECDETASDFQTIDLFDREAPMERRQAQLSVAERLIPTCSSMGYTLGTLLRHGEDLPGNLLGRDASRARDLILTHAETGYLPAYADLAEMALVEGNAREAMKWAQVYLRLLTHYSGRFDAGDSYQRSGFNGDLLLRAEAAWRRQRPKLSRTVITADLNEYLASRKTSVARGMAEHEARTQQVMANKTEVRVKRIKGSCDVDLGRKISGAYATFLVRILPDGSQGQVVAENFSPSFEAAMALKKCVGVYEFEPLGGNESQVVRIPVEFGYENGARLKL